MNFPIPRFSLQPRSLLYSADRVLKPNPLFFKTPPNAAVSKRRPHGISRAVLTRRASGAESMYMMSTKGSTNPEDVLLLAADAARLVLQSGAETYRAEETARAFCSALGGVEAECFATPTGIMLSFFGQDGRSRSVVRRISSRSMNLERIARLHALTRDLNSGRSGFEEAAAELDRIERMPAYRSRITLPAAAAAAGFFTLLFGGSWNDALAAAPIGALLARLTRQMSRKGISDFFTNIVGGAFAALACLSAGLVGLASNPDTAVIGAIMLLVPGVAVTNAIRDMIAGDLVAGVARGADAFISATGISIGAGAAFALWRLVGGSIL